MSQSQSQIKPIKINPELFTISSQKVKNKTLKNSKPIKPNKLKNDLLAKIKNYKHNKEISKTKKTNTTNTTQDTNTLLNTNTIPNVTKDVNSLNNKSNSILQSISNERTENKSIGIDDEFTASLNFLKELSSKKKKKNYNKEILVNNMDSLAIPEPNISLNIQEPIKSNIQEPMSSNTI